MLSQPLEQSTTWDRLWPLLVTAFLTLAVALAVQLFLVPRVERRKRREERWERDVTALGELLTFDLPNAARDYEALLREAVRAAQSAAEGGDPAMWQSAQRDIARDVREKRQHYQQVNARTRWLTDRVAPRQTVPDGGGGTKLWLALQRVTISNSLQNVDPLFRVEEPTDEVIGQGGTEFRKSLKEAVEELRQLSEKGPPKRAPAWRRIHVAAKRWRAGASPSPDRSGTSDPAGELN